MNPDIATPRVPTSDTLPAAAATLTGAAIGLSAYVVFSDVDRREAFGRFLGHLGLPAMVRGAGEVALERLSEMMQRGIDRGSVR